MRRLVVLAVVLSVVLPAGAAATQQANVTVESLTVTPQEPFVGETVSVTPTITNGQSSPTNVTIHRVELRWRDGGRLDSIRDLGRLPPGASISVPMDVTFDDPGSKDLRIVARGEDGNGNNVRLEYPVTVRVIDDHPDVRIVPPNRTTAGLDNEFEVRVENGFDRELRSVDVALDAPNVSFSPSSDGQPRLAGGETARFTFTASTNKASFHGIDATVSYRTSTGVKRTVERHEEFEFVELEESVTVDAARPPEGNFTVPVTVGNFGNAPIENVVVRAAASNGSVSPATVEQVPPGATREVTLRVSDVDTRADLDVTAEYDIGDRSGTATATTRVVASPDVPGEIQLTGLEVESQGDRLRITGSASNVGLRDVNSVIVRVLDTERVTPVAPNREFFVGTVPASDFVSFDVYARTDGNVSAVPLEVTYLSDGDRETVQARAPLDGQPAEPRADPGGSGGPNFLVIGLGAVVALGVGALVVVGWRNRGD